MDIHVGTKSCSLAPGSQAREVRRTTGGKNSNIEHAFDACLHKCRRNIAKLASHPTSWGTDPAGYYWLDQIDFFNIGNWTTSFHTGMALIAWRETEDEYFLRQVLSLEPLYRQKVWERATETMHDLGFLYSLYSVGLYKLTGEERHRETGLRAAEVLAQRFIPEGNYIQAWGRMDGSERHFQGLCIIDCLMNLPLLYWAALESGNARLHEIAVRHADTTLQHFIRADGSVYHSFLFDPKTGAPIGGANYCGYSVESHWARGTAWAIYGFALSHRYTGETRYLEASLRLARKFIDQLDDEFIPVWDFRLPAGAPKLRDSSAAAITVCGLQELMNLHAADPQLASTAKLLLARLCSDTYLDQDENVPGLLKNAQAGFSEHMAINCYSSWGDYFLTEALSRELRGSGTFW